VGQLWISVVFVVLGAIASGCLTAHTYERFEEAPLRAGWVELLEARPSRVRLSVKVEYQTMPPRKTLVDFDPGLEACASIRVLAQTGEADVYLAPGVRHALAVDPKKRDVLARKASAWKSGELADAECTVAILFNTYANEISLKADNVERRLGGASLSPPKNVIVLALLLPATAVVDVATFVPLLVWTCLTEDIDCSWVGAALSGWSGSY
jgi:hypothetical protein